MADGSDGAGGVGGSDGSGASDTSASNDSLGGLAESVSAAVSDLAEAVGNALGLDSGAVGDALSGLADALGLDVQDLQGIVGAAVLGAITGGLPGAVMGVVNGLVGGSLTDAAREAVAGNVPESLQPFAHLAIDTFAGRIPGANTSLQGALANFASGALTNGRAPDIADIGAVARSLADVRSLAGGLMAGIDVSSPQAAVASFEHALDRGFSDARTVAAGVVEGFARSGSAHAGGGHGAFGDAVETLAVDVARMLASR
ncbi:MAG: hypothetical protein KIS72_09490 [Luteimonas sp.]|nr:hypothetical protein [Luteimonas sp.]